MQIGTVTANITEYADQTCSPNTVYQYRVRALTATVASDYSNVSQAITLPAQTAAIVVDINTAPTAQATSSSLIPPPS